MPSPSHRPTSRSSSWASGSPSRAASVTSGPVRFSGCPPMRSKRSEATGLPVDMSTRASRTSALPEAYCSQHPRLPHSHRMPSGTTCMWPNSPAIPNRPRITRPSRTMPPPMPVPRLTMTQAALLCPAPKRYSAHGGVGVVVDEGGERDALGQGLTERLVAPREVWARMTVARSAATKPARRSRRRRCPRCVRRGAAPRPTRWCPPRLVGSSSGAACRGGPAAGRCPRRRPRRRPPWCHRCRCRSSSRRGSLRVAEPVRRHSLGPPLGRRRRSRASSRWYPPGRPPSPTCAWREVGAITFAAPAEIVRGCRGHPAGPAGLGRRRSGRVVP